MKSKKKPKLSNEALIKKLREELAEKNEILQAIQTGKVDALVITGNKGSEDTFTLPGAELPYQILIESMNEGAVTLIEDGTIVYSNKKFSEMVNVPQEKIIGSLLSNYILKNQNHKFNKLLSKSHTKNSKDVFTLLCFNNLHKTVYISCQVIKLKDTEATSCVITDITALKEAEQRYSTLMKNASCGIIIMNDSGIISEANKRSEVMLNTSRNEIIGSDIRDFTLQHEKIIVEKLLNKIIVDKSILPIEGHLKCPNNAIRDIIFSAVCIYFQGENLIMGIMTDVTETNLLRNQALLSDKLATIGTLASGIVHEINNPLTWILTNLNYIKERLLKFEIKNADQEKLRLKLAEAIDDSIQGTNKIKDITLNLKGFARADSKTSTSVDINEVVTSTIKMASIQFKNIVNIKKDLDPNIPLLELNKNKIHQVLLNVIVNAAQSMDEGNCKSNSIYIKTYIEKDNVTIDITDNGKGIPQEIINKIFEPFFTTKPIGVGTGLGLCLCYDILKNLGGNISVKSVVNQGSTFSINLPLKLKYNAANQDKSGIQNV